MPLKDRAARNAYQKLWRRRRYLEAKEQGLCGVCFKRPAVQGRASCQGCLDRTAAWMTAKRQDPAFLKDLRETNATRRAKEKDAAFVAYGGYRCVCCDVTERVFLTIDHIEEVGKGGPHRSGYPLYHWLMAEGHPPGFRVLCWNCNWATHRGGCPHDSPMQV